MADHNINFTFSGEDASSQAFGNGGTSSQNISGVLQSLNSAINTLNSNINKLNTQTKSSTRNTSSISDDTRNKDYEKALNQRKKDEEKFAKEYEKAVAQKQKIEDREIYQKRKFNEAYEKTLKQEETIQNRQQRQDELAQKQQNNTGMSIATIIGATLKQFLDIQATSIMSRAENTGQFIQSAIQGNANKSFGGYVNSLFQTDKAKQQAMVQVGMGTVTGGLGAIAGGVLAGPPGALAGYYIGSQLGNSLSAPQRAEIEKQQALKGALAERDAMASVSQWKTGFSRFGLARTNHEIVPGNITDSGNAINVPLSNEFQDKYGKSQNYNAIQNNISPYMQSSPLSTNLDKVAQNFLKAGFSAEEFSKLTTLGVKQQAMTGKDLLKFSEDVKASRAKFGDVFGASEIEQSLNLQAMGYGKTQADSLAFQSKYNPSVMNANQQFASQSISEWYANKALSNSIGIDINASLVTGSAIETKKGAINKLKSQLEQYNTGNVEPTKLPELMLAMQRMSTTQLGGLLNPKVQALPNAINETTGQSPAQDTAASSMIDVLKNGLSNVKEMTVLSQNVTIIDNGKQQFAKQMNEGSTTGYAVPPLIIDNHSPSKKGK